MASSGAGTFGRSRHWFIQPDAGWTPRGEEMMQQPADDLQAELRAELQTDARLVQRALREPEAFGVLYERFYPMILNYAFRRTLDITAAEELTSNTFFKALRALPKYRPGIQPLRAWLYSIATNELRMHWRWRRRHPAISLGDLDPEQRQRIGFDRGNGLERHAEREQRMADFVRLHHAIATLPQRHQAVLALRYFEHLSLEEIAKVIRRPIGSVKSRLHRATSKLRKAVELLPDSGIDTSTGTGTAVSALV